MTKLREILVAVFLALGMVSLALGQTTTTSTTLSAAVTETASTISVTSATGFTARTTMAYVDNEAMNVTAVSGTTITVTRGVNGTRANAHTSGETIWVGPLGVGPFVSFKKYGSCTSGSESYLPQIHIPSGDVGRCTNSEWAWEEHPGALKAKLDLHLLIDTTSDDRAVRINTRNYSTITSGTSLGFQSNPAQNVTTTGTVRGGEISPRVNNTFTTANLTGLFISPYLRGTTARTVSGNVRGIELEMITDDAGTNTISGYVAGIRMRSAFSATSIVGNFTPFRIEVPESQTNSQTYDALFDLTGTIPLVWNNAPGTEPSTADGYIKVFVNGAARYIQLYSTAPTD